MKNAISVIAVLVAVIALTAVWTTPSRAAEEPAVQVQEGAVKRVSHYLLAVAPGVDRISQAVSIDPAKTLVITSQAVEGNGITNSKAPNGVVIMSVTRSRISLRVEKDESSSRHVSLQVVEYE